MSRFIKKVFFTLGIACLGVISFGQTVTIGFGTESNYNVPYSNYYKYAVTQSLYTASEIGNAGQIASVAYNVATASSFANQDVKIYMGHTSLSTFASTSSALTEDDLALVYEGTLTLGASTGWEKIYLNEVFDYNGTDNLVIAVARKIPDGGAYNMTLKYYYSSGSTLFCRDDSDNTCGEISHAMSNSWAYRPNVQIGFTPSLVNGYYQIGDADDLLWFANYVNSGHSSINGKLTADIDLTDVAWTPIGSSNLNPYRGTFDGNCDTIRNLTYSKVANYAGLFGYVSGGTIQNVGLDNSSVTGSNYVGGIVGFLMSGTISKCCNKGAVSGSTAVGGIVGRCYSGSIENCFSMANVTANTSTAGGICGYNYNTTITNTYVGKNKTITAGTIAGGICGYNSGTLTSCHTIDISSVSSATYCGGLVGQDNGGTYSNCTYYQYAAMDGNSTRQNGLGNETSGSTTTNPTGISSKDSDFKSAVGSGNYCYLLNGSQNAGTVWKQTIGDDKYPVLDTTHLPIYKIGGRAYANKDITFSGGSGDPWTPFDISTAEELKNFAYLVNLGNKTLSGSLTTDIVLNENVLDENGNLRSDYKTANLEQWTPISSFEGSFFGNNHTISGLYINSSMEKVGLFKYVNGGSVSYLGIVDSYVSGTGYVGALAGQTYGARITSCYNTGVVEGSAYYVGGLFGMAGGTITNCYNTGNVSSKSGSVGGIGGCFGYYSGSATVTGCYNTGNVTSTSSVANGVGGLAGGLVNSTITFSKCYNTGTIIGKDKVGGCFGYLSSSSQSVTDCYNTGSVVATSGDAGGVVARNGGTISYCFNGGSVASTAFVGGIVGYNLENTNTGTVSYCYYNSDFCSHGGINSEDVANSAVALTSTIFTSSTLPTNFNSEVWTAGTTQGASGAIISEDGILGYRVIGKYPSITGVGTAQEIIVKYVNVGTEKQPNWISNFIPIYTISDFKNIANNLSATYVLMNDVVETANFSSLNVFTPTVTWPGINPFTGKIYGNNHTVSGVYIDGTVYGHVGLIDYAKNGAVIRDLGLIESRVIGETAGGICGYAENATILNCYNSAEVIGTIAGGITHKGYNATITQCKNYGTITATEKAGGIIGELYFTTVQQCYNEGTITSDLKAGGIAGEGGYDKIYNSYNAGAVSGQMAGGILGVNGTVQGHSNCLNIGKISGSVNAGGILGGGSAGSDALKHCYYDINTSNVEGGINSADALNMAEGIETDDLCLELQKGFSSDIWGLKEPVVVGNKKYLYYPYLKCFGEESAKIGTYRPISRVVLNENGGTCTPLTQYIEREGAELPQDVVRDGFTFGGWYTNASCTSDEVTEIPVTATGEQTFYAKWTENTYNVSLNPHGGKINMGDVTTYTYGTYTMLPQDVTRTGYAFKGWFPVQSYNIVLESFTRTSDVILKVRDLWGVGLIDARNLVDSWVDNTPLAITTVNSYADAAYYKTQLQSVGAVISFDEVLSEGGAVCDLILESYPDDKKVKTITKVRDYAGIGLMEAKVLVESAPVTVLTQVPAEIAQALKNELDALGCVSSFENSVGGTSSTMIYPTDLGDKYFGAKWEANTYSVNLQVNGGTNTNNVNEYTYGVGATLPDDSEIFREGYTFAGWYMNSNYDGVAIEEISTTDFGDKTYYAKWNVDSYDITLDIDGGTINSGNIDSYTYGVGATLPTDITKTGYSFKGWYDNSSYTGDPISSVLSTETGDKEFYARWDVNKYTITYVTNNGTINAGNITQYKYGNGVTLPTNVTKTGYAFEGWYTNDSYAGESVSAISNTTTGDKTFYAKWDVNSYDITLNTKGGTINNGNVNSYTYGVGATLPTDVTKTGCTFLGWYDNSSCSGPPVLSIASNAIDDKEFWAKWDTINYTITYNANEGVFATTPAESYKYGDEVTLPTPTREGYTFAGWYNNSNLVGTEFAQIESTETGNKEFWAKWDVNTYTVSLDAKGGDINSGNVASYTYNVLTILPQDVTKVGHTFEGWFDSENQKVTQISKGTIGDVTFTAKWTAKTYSVTLQANNGTVNAGNITSYTYGLGATLPEDVTKTGYEFLGWFDNSSYDGGKVTKIADNEIGNKNFWAKWTAASYEVTLDAAGGTINSNAIERYTYGVGAVLPTDVTKTGFEFKGWKDEENADALEITSADYGNKTFTAQWEKADYSIAYNANGGTINESYETTYNYGDEITLPTDVTKDGCEFQGWYDNSNFTGEAVEAISATEFGDKTFYAKWFANSYSVVFNTNEGTINSGNIEGYTYGVTAILPTDVTKDGYTFTGWYSDEECEGEVVSIISSTETGNKRFFAGWSNTAYSITLHTNDGIISSGNVTAYTFGTEVQLPSEEQISKTGYTFGGWYDNSSCTGTAQTAIFAEATGNKSFWAKWTVNTYDVTLVANGGTVNSGNVASYTYGVGANLPSDVTKTGHTFAGWYDNAEFAGDRQTRIDEYATEDKTFHANWTANEYTITYEVTGGSIEDANYKTAYVYGSETTLPATVSKTGHTFAGWFTNSAFEGSAMTGISATEYGNKTFYAKWNVNSYKVTLNANEGSINNGNVIKYVYGSTVVLPSDVTKTGYTFNGWYDNDEFAGEAVTTIANNETGDKVFYAKWTINTYEVTLNANGGTINAGEISSYEFGTASTLPSDVVKTGYTFAGWYDNANLTGEVFTAIANNVTGAKSFYAKWNINTYRVTLNANEGSINNGNVTNYVYGSTVVLPSDVTKTGYTFNGWFDNDEFVGEAITTIANNETGDKTFYAKFSVNTYNVILVTNEGVINSGNIESYEFGTGATLPTNVTKTGYTFDGWYSNTSYVGGSVSSIADNDMGDKQFWAKWTINEYEVAATAENGTVEGTGSYEYKSTATLKAIANEGYEFVGWNDGELKDERMQLTVTKDTTLVANFKEKEKVQISGTLEIPTLKTEREAQPIDLAGLFTTTEGGEVIYSAASSAPNVVAATVSEGKLFLTVYEYEGESEITVTATLPNGEKNTVKATATVVLACNIQVEETITNVSCYGESDGEIALKVTNAAEPYTTLWTGDATEDTLRNVTAGNYTVDITDNEGCTFTKTYTVTQPEEMSLSAKIKNPTCENADGAITVTLTGAESAAFAWSNGATTQNVASLEKGEYSLVVTNTETGCQIGDNFTLVEPDAPVVTVSNVVSTACNASNGAVTISVNEEDLIYNWSNNKQSKNLTNVPAGDYTLSVVNPETNCTATLEVTVPSIKLKQPEIALVTVSEQTGKNLVVWLKENTDLIQRYNIYRESETANVYTKIAEVPYSELSVYEDLEANPAVTAWRYKISATDVCNEETELGEYHKTIHLMQNQGLGGVYNLDWNTYEGLDFPTYVVIRKSVVRKVVTMDTIAYLSSNNNTYTDTLPAKGTQAYYVGMVLPEEINPMTQFMKAESGPFSIALSNIAEVESDGPDAVYDLNGSNAKAYAWGHTIYVKGAEGEDVAVYDVNGRKIDAAEGQDEYEFNVRLDGVYFVKVGEYTFKVVVE